MSGRRKFGNKFYLTYKIKIPNPAFNPSLPANKKNNPSHEWKSKAVPVSKDRATFEEFKAKFDYKHGRRKLHLPDDKSTFADLLAEFEEHIKEKRLKPKSCSRYHDTFNSFKKIVHPDRMSDVTVNVARGWKEARTSQVAPATFNLDLRNLRSAWKKAILWGLAEENPFAQIEPLKQTHRRREIAADPDAVEKLLTAAEKWNPEYWLLAMTARFSGLRLSEITHLQTAGLDMAGGWVKVEAHPCACRECEKIGGLWTPKSYQQRRVPLHARLRAALKQHPRAPGITFPGLDGGVRTARSVEKLFERLFVKAKVPRPPRELVHVFRHAFGSENAKAGIPLPTLRVWMGHKDIRTTMIYYHEDDAHSQEMMRKAERYSRGDGENLVKRKICFRRE